MKTLPWIIGYALLGMGSSLHAAEALPLSPSFWRDPAFVKSFNGSYRIEARIEPVVSTEERGLLVQVQELMEAGNRRSALAKLKESSLTSKSAALTFNLGNLEFEEGNMEAAEKAYEGAIESYPSFRRAHRNLGVVLVRADKHEAALKHLIEAVKLGDSDGSTYGLLAYCRLQQGEWASALQAYRMAQVSEPDAVEWKAGVAQCLQQLEAQDEAVALLDEVIRERPEEASYAVLQASLLIELGRISDAVKTLELPRRLERLDGDGLVLLAELNLREQRPEEAMSRLEGAFSGKSAPSEARAMGTLGFACSVREWEVARLLLAKVKAMVTGEAPRALRLAEAKLEIDAGESPEKGASLLKALIDEDPTDGVALLELGKYEISGGKNGEGELLLERATAVEGSAADAWVEIAKLRVAESRFGAALKAVDEALKLRPGGSLETYRESLAKLADAAS
ncbi:tetratricopeptide (TPR) repeat protein [Haloferula luteola]|uniref:Tetratricopeptide (TPR) repeat protein n=1 Tax=Haloferula luteola TaxID=595692 RepID=A0A840V710_9BACT|nr:tetratricopeptide repeat protein [Haloferula luteola]MBB5352826.1 tetratricopeptide (TPR) repeat protein [Haloferula luteola]